MRRDVQEYGREDHRVRNESDDRCRRAEAIVRMAGSNDDRHAVHARDIQQVTAMGRGNPTSASRCAKDPLGGFRSEGVSRRLEGAGADIDMEEGPR